MDRKLETMFDVVEIKGDALVLDSTEMTSALEEQRSLTMRRVASWLRNNGRIFKLEWDYIVAKELEDLFDPTTRDGRRFKNYYDQWLEDKGTYIIEVVEDEEEAKESEFSFLTAARRCPIQVLT